MPENHDARLELASSELVKPDTDYLVGISGGRDSMVLLHWLVSLGCQRLVVCHFNHSLRAEDSNDDQQLVTTTSKNLGFECIVEKDDSNAFAKQTKQSLETAARESRYRFFAEVAEQKQCPRLILAHHANDQSETILMNLFRGSGLKGLAGMQPSSTREINGAQLEIIRPFLQVPRTEIDHYQQVHQINFREDATNSEPIAVRNRVRNELLPLANDIFSRDISVALQRLSEIASMESSATEWRAKQWLEEYQTDSGIPVRELRSLPAAELHHVLHYWLAAQKVGNCGLKEVKLMVNMIRSDSKPAKINLPGDLYARRRSGIVFIDNGK